VSPVIVPEEDIMTRRMRATVVAVRPELKDERLRVFARVRTEGGEMLEAGMPDREVSAILPRSVLVGEGTTAPRELLSTIQPILARMSEGRVVRVWDYKDRKYFSFHPWKGVRFTDGEKDRAEGE
jgi:hypothetical protein